MLDRNCMTGRFLGTRDSALRLPLIEAANKKSSLILQQKMVDLRNKLPEMSAGARLFSESELLIKQRQEILERIRNDMHMKHCNQDKTSYQHYKKNIRVRGQKEEKKILTNLYQ